ncbi:hypothetical protein [Bifidobacterium sp. SO4]|uniref:hypothetical protein n=1 Tax=Bifidobacterium sp. SO4 TaxID=2809030 RepID=UPI001BDCA789|nr:hypothetical protein [Bifidobacterium sp. SO4]MBT1171001.1 hypothetical protein [Bifidobacterium sp. SO4]
MDTVFSEDFQRATAVLEILRPEGDTIVLSGDRHVPPNVLLCDPTSIRIGKREDFFLARISYHLQPKHLAEGAVLTCRKRPFAEIRDERLMTLARMSRRAGIGLLIECALSLGYHHETCP